MWRSRGITGVVLAAMVAVLAGVWPATSAANDTPVEIIDEQTQSHCGTVGSADCHIVAESVGDITWEAFGAVRMVCHMEFELELNEGGTGQVVDQVLTGSNCITPPCGAPDPWPVLGLTEEGGALNMRMEYCVEDPDFGDIVCILNIDVQAWSHTALTMSAAPPQSVCEGSGGLLHNTGSWTAETEVGSELEVVHL